MIARIIIYQVDTFLMNMRSVRDSNVRISLDMEIEKKVGEISLCALKTQIESINCALENQKTI